MQQENSAHRETRRITKSQRITYALYCVTDFGLRFCVSDVRTFQGPKAEPVLNGGGGDTPPPPPHRRQIGLISGSLRETMFSVRSGGSRWRKVEDTDGGSV
jgi:hypothetical protein